jgi:hypothetical protein
MMPCISPPLRMMARACRALLERFASGRRRLYVQQP